MIIVRTGNTAADKYETGVRFNILDDRLNVYDDKNCIATYAKGFWASVSVDPGSIVK